MFKAFVKAFVDLFIVTALEQLKDEKQKLLKFVFLLRKHDTF